MYLVGIHTLLVFILVHYGVSYVLLPRLNSYLLHNPFNTF